MVGAYLSSFSFGAFPNRLDQQLMVEIASLLLMAVQTDAAVEEKKLKNKREFSEQQKLDLLNLLNRTKISHFLLFLKSCIHLTAHTSSIKSTKLEW